MSNDGSVEFGRYAEERRAKRGDSPPETFDFLGFTHISGKTRRGDFTIHRKTSRKKKNSKPSWLHCEWNCYVVDMLISLRPAVGY